MVLLGMAIEIGLIGLVLSRPQPGATASFLALFGAIFVCYLIAVRRAPAAESAPAAEGMRIIMIFAVLFRLTLLPAAPALSTDMERYLWDGRVVAAGGNPYLSAPADRELVDLRDERFDRLEHREVRTIYPPLAQALFAAVAATGAGRPGLKIILIACDLLVIILIGRLLALRRLPRSRVLVYAWNPLAVIEVAWSGHLEPAGAALMLLAAGAIIQKRDLRAVVALTAACLVKLLPIVLLVPFRRAIRPRALLLIPAMVGFACWPFRDAGPALGAGLREYAATWSANESLFGLIHAAIAWLDPTAALKGAIAAVRSTIPATGWLDRLYDYVYPTYLARAVCAACVVLIAWVIDRRSRDPLRSAFLLLGAILLFSPTLHPWYLLWILPWLCLYPSRPWLALTGLLALSYVNLGFSGDGTEPYPWIGWAVYLPFYGLLAVEWLRRPARLSAGTQPSAAGASEAGDKLAGGEGSP